MIVTDGEKVMTLEELAGRICDSIEFCEACPAYDYCYNGHNGMIDLLRKVVSGEQD